MLSIHASNYDDVLLNVGLLKTVDYRFLLLIFETMVLFLISKTIV